MVITTPKKSHLPWRTWVKGGASLRTVKLKICCLGQCWKYQKLNCFKIHIWSILHHVCTFMHGCTFIMLAREVGFRWIDCLVGDYSHKIKIRNQVPAEVELIVWYMNYRGLWYFVRFHYGILFDSNFFIFTAWSVWSRFKSLYFAMGL